MWNTGGNMPSAAKRAEVVRRAVGGIRKTLPSSLDPEVEASAVERALQVAIEALLDMGEMVISQQRGIPPQTYKGIADELRRLGV